MDTWVAPSEADKDRILTMLARQYVALNANITENIRGLYLLLGATGTMLATALGAGFYLWDKPIASAAIFNVVIPTLLAAAGLGLMISMLLMVSLGTYIKVAIEGPVEVLLGDELKTWLQTKVVDRKFVGLSSRDILSTKVIGWESLTHARLRDKKGSDPIKISILLLTALFAAVTVTVIIVGEIRVFSPSGWDGQMQKTRVFIEFAPLVVAIFGLLAVKLLYGTMERMMGIDRGEVPRVSDNPDLQHMRH